MPELDPLALVLSVVAFVAFVGLILGVVVLVARAFTRSDTPAPPRDPAMDVLRTRFARGEIDDAEFERLRSSLQRH